MIPKGGNQNVYIEEEQTTQRPKDKVQMDKQRSTKHYKGVYLLYMSTGPTTYVSYVGRSAIYTVRTGNAP